MPASPLATTSPRARMERAANPATEKAVDYTLADLKLDVPGSKLLDVIVGDSVTGAEVELTIEGASTVTLTVEDPEGNLLRSDTLTRWAWGNDYLDERSWIRHGQAVDARLDDLWFRLVRVEPSGTSLTLTFEDRDVAWLRRHKGSRKASRAKATRAEFVKMLVDEVRAGGGITLYCPELHIVQPIAKAADRLKKSDKRDAAHSGFAKGVELKGKAKLTAGQVHNAERVLDVADSLSAPERATLALVVACIVEAPDFTNPSGGDGSSVGILQLTSDHYDGSVSERRDIERVCHDFLTKGFRGLGGAIALSRKHPDWSVAEIANGVQGPRAGAAAYSPWVDAARKIVSAYKGGGGSASTYWKRYEYARGKDETSWDAIGRLADEVGWRRFMRRGRLWFISEEDLFAQAPAFVMEQGKEGVDSITGPLDLNARHPVAELTALVRADRWAIWPGQTVQVKGRGPFDGRWLVSSVRRGLLDTSGAVEVQLRKPIPEKPEPRSEQGTVQDDGGGDGAKPELAYAAAAHIDKQDRPYVYGGGHKALSAIEPHEGLDCSSSCSLVLSRAGMFDGKVAITSGAFASSWGRPGRGKYLTVWANANHVWIEFHLDGKRGKRFDTSPHGSGGSGPHLRYTERSTAGFTPRHWPGT